MADACSQSSDSRYVGKAHEPKDSLAHNIWEQLNNCRLCAEMEE